MRKIEVKHLENSNMRKIDVKRLDEVREIEVKHFDLDRVLVTKLDKINLKMFDNIQEYLLAFSKITSYLKEMVPLLDHNIVNKMIENYDLAEYITRSNKSEFSQYNTNEISNNLLYILNYLLRKGHRPIDGKLYEDFIFHQKLKNMISDIKLKPYTPPSIVVKSPHAKNNKDSDIVLSLGGDWYKQIHYNQYEKLKKIKNVHFEYSIRSFAPEDDDYFPIVWFKYDINTIEDLINILHRFLILSEFAGFDLSSAFDNFHDAHVDKLEVTLKNGKVKNYTYSEFENTYFPAGI